MLWLAIGCTSLVLFVGVAMLVVLKPWRDDENEAGESPKDR